MMYKLILYSEETSKLQCIKLIRSKMHQTSRTTGSSKIFNKLRQHKISPSTQLTTGTVRETSWELPQVK